jgi:hypothetical protein
MGDSQDSGGMFDVVERQQWGIIALICLIVFLVTGGYNVQVHAL